MIDFTALDLDQTAAVRDAAASRVADLNVEAATARDAGPAEQLLIAETVDHLAEIYRQARDRVAELDALARVVGPEKARQLEDDRKAREDAAPVRYGNAASAPTGAAGSDLRKVKNPVRDVVTTLDLVHYIGDVFSTDVPEIADTFFAGDVTHAARVLAQLPGVVSETVNDGRDEQGRYLPDVWQVFEDVQGWSRDDAAAYIRRQGGEPEKLV